MKSLWLACLGLCVAAVAEAQQPAPGSDASKEARQSRTMSTLPRPDAEAQKLSQDKQAITEATGEAGARSAQQMTAAQTSLALGIVGGASQIAAGTTSQQPAPGAKPLKAPPEATKPAVQGARGTGAKSKPN